MNKIGVVIIFTLFLVSCGVSEGEYADLKAQNDELKKTNESLKDKVIVLELKLDEVRFGAEKLLAEAKDFFEKKDYHAAANALEKLIKKHPSSNQAKEGKILFEKVDKMLIAERKSLANALSNMRPKVDKIKDIIFYYDKSTPGFIDTNSFHFYIGKRKDSLPWLVMQIQYAGDNWLFIEKYIIKTEQENFEITPRYGEIKRDNAAGEVWEWYSDVEGDKYVKMIKAIISSKEPIIRYEGKDYYKDRKITVSEKKALKNILDAYEVLKAN
ncbi:MAG: hypothetical protein ACM3SY_07710 [Candidatus Omnitrophota bacterium]